jgi:hypothetical protein
MNHDKQARDATRGRVGSCPHRPRASSTDTPTRHLPASLCSRRCGRRPRPVPFVEGTLPSNARDPKGAGAASRRPVFIDLRLGGAYRRLGCAVSTLAEVAGVDDMWIDRLRRCVARDVDPKLCRGSRSGFPSCRSRSAHSSRRSSWREGQRRSCSGCHPAPPLRGCRADPFISPAIAEPAIRPAMASAETATASCFVALRCPSRRVRRGTSHDIVPSRESPYGAHETSRRRAGLARRCITRPSRSQRLPMPPR